MTAGPSMERARKIAARMRRRYRLEHREDPREGTCWMVLDRANSGSGAFGDEAAGRDKYEITIMFRTLEALDPNHEWHQYDWHLLTGTAEDRIEALLGRRAESDAAAREVSAINALVRAVVRDAH